MMPEPQDTQLPNGTAQLRAILQRSDDNALSAFLYGYSLGMVADLLIATMNEPNVRIEFLAAVAKTYPADWKAANVLSQIK
jgi:ATP-dependent exoDNAse (exonuclease V) beta subunit